MKRILCLPSWTMSDWLHHRHGANIPDLLITTMISRKRASKKMKVSTDPISQFTGDRIDQTNGEQLQRLHINETTSAKNEIRNKEKSVYHDRKTVIVSLQPSKVKHHETGPGRNGV